MFQSIDDWVEKNREESIIFLQKLIQTPSPSLQEREAAELVAEKMRASGFNTVRVDDVSDAMGTINGSGDGRSLLLNGHIDHVPVGDMVDPYSGRVMDGSAFGVEGEVVYGRAASDMKGAVAAMVMAGAALRDLGLDLKGDYKVAAVAQEEVGGAGSMSTINDSQFLADVVLIGEATNMDLALGHRGSMKMSVVVKGRSCHASAPERGVNALYKALTMIDVIRSDLAPRLPKHPLYGKTSLVVTQIEVKPKAFNVVPEECQFHIDCRNTPNFPVEDLYQELNNIVATLKAHDPEFQARVLPISLITGRRSFSGFYTDPREFPVVEEASNTIRDVLGKEPTQKTWTFATDGRMYSWMGLPVIGFGPGEERFAHTHQDHVRVEDYLDAIRVYAALACRICGVKG